jgi:LysM repeat protein
MDKHHHSKLLFIGSLLFMALAASGCFQQAGSGLEPLSAPQTAPTFTLPPSETPLPPPPTDTPIEPTEPPTQAIAEVPTDTLQPPPVVPTEAPLPTIDTSGQLPVPTIDTSGQQPFPTIDTSGQQPFPTADTSGQQPLATLDTSGQMIFPTIDPNTILPTNSQGIAQVPTDTGFDANQGQIPDLDATSTAIIQGATATESFIQTSTAVGEGIGFPTSTPTTEFVPTQQQLLPTDQGQGGSAPTVSGNDCVYTVVQGDNLFRIALRYNVPLSTVAQANNISNPALILVGQQIVIPGCGGGTTGGGTTSGGGTTYVVQQGDTLFKISLRYGVPVNSIAAANGISNINLIYINQRLTIPGA